MAFTLGVTLTSPEESPSQGLRNAEGFSPAALAWLARHRAGRRGLCGLRLGQLEAELGHQGLRAAEIVGDHLLVAALLDPPFAEDLVVLRLGTAEEGGKHGE